MPVRVVALRPEGFNRCQKCGKVLDIPRAMIEDPRNPGTQLGPHCRRCRQELLEGHEGPHEVDKHGQEEHGQGEAR